MASGVDKWHVKVADAVPASEGVPSKGPTYRWKKSAEKFPTLEDVSTTWDIFVRSAQLYGDRNFLGTREIVDGKAGKYVFQTYSQAFETIKVLGSAFRHFGVQTNGRVGIYGANSPQWFQGLAACASQSIYCVPLYDSLGADAVEFIIRHAEVTLVIVQETKLAALTAALKINSELVKTVVSMGELPDDAKASLEALGLKAFSWQQFLDEGKANPAEPTPPSPDDFATIMYTSGTTGEPKGVLIKHSAFIASIAGNEAFLEFNEQKLDCNDVFLSYLPLAHIYDQISELFMAYLGASIGFWQGDVKQLTDDISELKPTFFVGVPRIFDRIYSGIKSKVEADSWLKKTLFGFAFGRKLSRLQSGVNQSEAAPISDAIVFSKVKSKLGGRVRVIISGAAPLAPHVEEFLKVTMCAPVVQGYGLTETSAGAFIALIDHMEMSGTVGPAMPSIETRLESVLEMNYDALGSPARGEILVRGDTLFSGYYKRDDLTKEVVDDDGWFHTGDIGEWQPNGAMKIIDRKKNIFKLSQGEYVAVESLENTFGNCPVVDQIWVYGNSFESVLVAVVVPNDDSLASWAKKASIEGDYAALCASNEAKNFILDELNSVGKAAKLKGFEFIKAVHLESVPFDIERDLLTPTFKKKRPQLLKFYKDIIDGMYTSLKAQ